MDPKEILEVITLCIHNMVSLAGTRTKYRVPIIGYAKADAPEFLALKELVDESHCSPVELLPGARSVVVYFLPFAANVPKSNRGHPFIPSDEWAIAYVETNDLLTKIAEALHAALQDVGVKSASEPPTHKFDEEKLLSSWSHKSAAVIAGIGSFGLHHVVITDSGCAGRFGSIVIDADLPEKEDQQEERCLYFLDGSCGVCVEQCPAEAIQYGGSIDKKACWELLLESEARFLHFGKAQVCGKCLTGPCAVKSAV